MAVHIRAARGAHEHRAAQHLLVLHHEEGHAVLGEDLCSEALWTVEDYAPPNMLLLAWEDDAVGMVGLRRIDEAACEMRRHFVAPDHRGRGAGRALAEAALDAARSAGHRRMLLAVPAGMAAARRLYARMGFCERPPFGDARGQDPVFMERHL